MRQAASWKGSGGGVAEFEPCFGKIYDLFPGDLFSLQKEVVARVELAAEARGRTHIC